MDTQTIPTRLQIASANRMAQGLALADAQQKASELFLAMDAYLRALKGLQACGASKAFLWDAGAGAHDQASSIMGRIDRELDAQGLYPLDALDLAYAAEWDGDPDALEAALGCPGGSLRRSVSRFNKMALRGIDADHRRGQSVFERRYGDAANLPNPALGPLAMAPFYAIKVIPGDIGTFIGLPIDGAARVLDGRARAVPGLYAAGNAAQSLFGGHYPSAGITLGPALTFGWLAARHALGHSDADRSPPDLEGALRDANATHPIA
jgi:hypothetical protein